MIALPPGFSRATRIGEGAFGTVFRAREDATGRVVALKRLAKGTSASAEAALLARDVSCLPALHSVVASRGASWISMEHVHGLPLSSIGPLDLGTAEVESIAAALGSAVALLHGAGIPHGDLKPENVILEPDGRVRLLDLGLSRSGSVGGSTGYAAPEAGSPGADPFRCDLWSLGRILHELLVGARPGVSERRSGWVRLEAAAPSWKPVLQLLLAEDPSARPANAAVASFPPVPAWTVAAGERIRAAADRVLAGHLARRAEELVREGEPGEAIVVLQESLDLDPDQSLALDLLGRIRIERRRPRWPWFAAASVAIAAMVAGWMLLVRDDADPSVPVVLEKDRVRLRPDAPPAVPVPLREGDAR